MKEIRIDIDKYQTIYYIEWCNGMPLNKGRFKKVFKSKTNCILYKHILTLYSTEESLNDLIRDFLNDLIRDFLTDKIVFVFYYNNCRIDSDCIFYETNYN